MLLNSFTYRPASELKPGKVYVMESAKYRPGQVKLGLSWNEASRKATGKTWLEDLTVLHEQAFLHMGDAEAAMHKHFSAVRVDGSEWFAVSPDEAVAVLDKLSQSEASARAKLSKFVRDVIELGLVTCELPEAPNTALEALWRWRPTKQAAQVRELIASLRNGGAAATEAATHLRKAGFVVVLSEQDVLFGLAAGTPLVRYLDKEVGPGRWEHQLRDVAGLSFKGEPIALEAWKRKTTQHQDTVDYITSRGGNPRLTS